MRDIDLENQAYQYEVEHTHPTEPIVRRHSF